MACFLEHKPLKSPPEITWENLISFSLFKKWFFWTLKLQCLRKKRNYLFITLCLSHLIMISISIYLQHLSLRLFAFKNIRYKNLIKLADHLNQQSLIVYLLNMTESMETGEFRSFRITVFNFLGQAIYLKYSQICFFKWIIILYFVN